jgi:hypothetical protein
MRSILLFIALAVVPLPMLGETVVPIPAASQDSTKVHAEWSTEVFASNNVVWRGFLSNKVGTLQPSITLDFGALSVTSTSVLEFDGQYCWKEHDLQVSYSKPLSKRFSLTSGYTNYAYPSLEKDRFAHEFFTGLTMEGNTGARPQTFQNVGLSSGTYISAEISRSFRSAAKFPIHTVASVGYNRKLFIPEATFSDAVVTVSTDVPLRSGLSLAPQIGYSRGLNRRYFDNYITVGLRLVYKPERLGLASR